MQNLIAQASRDKTDMKNKELLKRMQEKAKRINDFTNEKNRKEEQRSVEKMEREQLLKSALKNDNDYIEAEEARKRDFAIKLTQMHAENLQKEKMQRDHDRMMEEKLDRDARDNSIRMADENIRKRRQEILK